MCVYVQMKMEFESLAHIIAHDVVEQRLKFDTI